MSKISKLIRIVTFIAVMFAATPVMAQKISNGNYGTCGYIKSDGTIQDSSYRTIGHIKSDGTVQDSNYRTIGHIKSDGTVQDSNYRTIGHAPGINRNWVALFFFFQK